MKRIIALVLAVLMLGAMAVSCVDPTPGPGATTTTPGGATTTPDPSDTTTTPNTTTPPEPQKVPAVADDVNLPKIDPTTLEIVNNGSTKFAIVYPFEGYAEAGAIYKEHADSLLRGLLNKYRAAFSRITDDAVPADSSRYEILVGPTNRPESQMALAFANGVDGFVVKAIGNKLVINAYTNNGLVKAIEYFNETYLSGSGTKFTFTSENDYASEQEYAHPEYTLAGYSWATYTIVIPKDAEYSIQRTARRVQMALGTTVGEIPAIVYDDAKGHAENFEILIGKTNRTSEAAKSVEDMEYYIGLSNAKLEITAGSSFGYELAAIYAEGNLWKDLNKEATYNCGEFRLSDIVNSIRKRGNNSAEGKARRSSYSIPQYLGLESGYRSRPLGI